MSPRVETGHHTTFEQAAGDGTAPPLSDEPVHEADPRPEILTVEEFAVRMRWNRKTAYERIRRGEVVGLMPGKPYRIYWPAVVASVLTGQGRAPLKRGRK